MSVWTWVLIGLCAAGAVLALVSAVPVIRLALRIRARARSLQSARLFMSVEALQLQGKRLQRTAAQAMPLAQRAQVAVQRIRAAAADPEYVRMREALESTGSPITALLEALR